jgi:hypothetical protein
MSVNSSVLYKIVFLYKLIYSFVDKNLLPDIVVHINEPPETLNNCTIDLLLSINTTVWSEMFL